MLPDYRLKQRFELLAQMGNGNYMKQNWSEFEWAFFHVVAHVGIIHTLVEVGAMGGANTI